MNNGQEKGAVKNRKFVITIINDWWLSFAVTRTISFSSVKTVPPRYCLCLPSRQQTSWFSTPPLGYLYMTPPPSGLIMNWTITLQLTISGGFHLFLLGELSKLGVISPARWFLWTVAPLKRVEELLVSLGSFRDTFPLSFLTVNIVKHLDPHYQAREYWCGRWKCFPENPRPGGIVIQTIVLH